MTTVAEKYLQIAKLAKDPANAEVVIDGILTFFGLDYFDLDLGVEYLYTTKVIDYKFRSVLHKAEDMDAIMAWFKEKAGRETNDRQLWQLQKRENRFLPACRFILPRLRNRNWMVFPKKKKLCCEAFYNGCIGI